MNTKALIIVAASLLAACSHRTITMTLNEETAKAFRDTNAAKLTTLLKSINYPVTVTHEAEGTRFSLFSKIHKSLKIFHDSVL